MSVEYFFDECTIWELNDLIDNIKYLDRNLWESSRLNSFITAKANFNNINNINDVFPLPWDEDNISKENQKRDIEITNDEIKRMKELEKLWAG